MHPAHGRSVWFSSFTRHRTGKRRGTQSADEFEDRSLAERAAGKRGAVEIALGARRQRGGGEFSVGASVLPAKAVGPAEHAVEPLEDYAAACPAALEGCAE